MAFLIYMEETQRILVVDDNRYMRDYLRGILGLKSQGGYEVDTAEDGQEGLEKLNGHYAVFTDLGMSRLDGVGFIKGAREAGYEGPIFLMTGNSGELDQFLARHGLTREQFFSRSYCNGSMRKPFAIDKPLQMIKDWQSQ